VLILPVCLDQTRPYGFIAAFQGHLLCDPIEPEIFRRPLAARFPRVLIAIMIDALADARSWRGAEALFQPLLPHLAELTSAEATRLAEVSTRNGEFESLRSEGAAMKRKSCTVVRSHKSNPCLTFVTCRWSISSSTPAPSCWSSRSARA
jgi:hypothetical protein